jgi:hypothetical protein
VIGQVIAVLVIVAAVGLMVLGAYLWHKVVGTPSDRERALEARLDAMKRANYLGAEFFSASTQMRDEMARAARGRQAGSRNHVRAGRQVVDADWHD